MLKVNNFIENVEETDTRYTCYNIDVCVNIFKQLIKDIEDLKIYISKETSLENVIDSINQYLIWINQCGEILRDYYESELGEKVYDDWFSHIEVYDADIVFNSIEDYGATIYCGDQVICDHSLEIQFDGMNVETIRLNG